MIAYGKIMLQFYTYMHIKSYLYEMNDVIIRLIGGFFFISQSKKILKFSSIKNTQLTFLINRFHLKSKICV